MNCKFFVTISLFVMIFISAIATDVSGDVCAVQDSDGMVYEVVNIGGIYFLRTKVDQFTKRDNNDPCSGISSAFIGLQVELTRIATKNGTYPALTDYDMPYVSLDNYALLNISSAKINGTSIDIDYVLNNN